MESLKRRINEDVNLEGRQVLAYYMFIKGRLLGRANYEERRRNEAMINSKHSPKSTFPMQNPFTYTCSSSQHFFPPLNPNAPPQLQI